MTPIGRALFAFVASLFRWRLSLQLEIVALWHQLTLYHRWIRRPHVRLNDRTFWSWLGRPLQTAQDLWGANPNFPRLGIPCNIPFTEYYANLCAPP
jgi:hypothetical protein